MSSFDIPDDPFSPTDNLDKEAILDRTKLTFGKYRNKTPEQIAEKDPQYLVWAYETVAQFNVCSAALYRDCGGKGKRAVKEEKKPAAPAQPLKRLSSGDFDDYDDDIPF